MMFWQSVHGNGHAKSRDIHPLLGNRNNAAGHQQRVNTHLSKQRQDPAQFPVPDHRLAANQGNMNRLMLSDEPEHALDESISTKIPQLRQCDSTTKMVLTIGIATRAA